MYCVYKHTCPNGKVYIGITSQNVKTRWANGHGYDTQFFGKAIKKYGWDNISHDVIESGLTFEEANEKEIFYIAQYRSNNPKYGYNCTDGGAGTSGHEVSEETRKKMSITANRTWSNAETRERLLGHLRDMNEGRRGKPLPREWVRNSALARGRAINQFTKDGEFVQSFPTIMDAAKSFGAKDSSLLVACCKKTKNTGRLTAIYGGTAANPQPKKK